jgi:hypothetical protein
MRYSPQFSLRISKKEIVMSNEPLVPACCLDQASVVDFPKSQTKRIRRSVSLPHRVSDFQWITHDDERFQPGQKILPKRQRQTVARILPAPDACGSKSFDQQLRFQTQWVKPGLREILVSLRRQIPGTAELIQQFVIQRHEPQMFPEAIRVIGLRGHQFILWTQVEAASTQKLRKHRRS